jgi:hypothetical protein
MRPTGIIFATLDCDADSIEQWNRWYDLEHTPPNLAIDGVTLSRRYVAPPELHAMRVVDPSSAMANGLGTFVTIYTLCAPPAEVIATMSVVRDELSAAGRMTFPAEKKVVRPMGGALAFVSAVSSKDIALPSEEVPFVGHTAMLVVHRRSSDPVADWYRTEWAARVVDVEGVHGVATYDLDAPGEQFDLVHFEGDPLRQTEAIRGAAPHHDDAVVLADAPFLLINPLDYPWAESIRSSTLPTTVTGGGS